MRLLAGGGYTLQRPTALKVKGLQIVPTAANVATDAAGWGPMWNTFDWAGWIKPQIDLAVANGANCVKITGSGATAAYPASATFLSRVRQFLDYCRQVNLLVYWTWASTDWSGTTAAAIAAIPNILPVIAGYPHVIGIDLVNEMGEGGEPTLAQTQTLLDAARPYVGSKPMTASLLCTTPAALTDGRASSLASRVDYFDFHTYFQFGGVKPTPAASDFDTFRSSGYYKPWLIGECGEDYSDPTLSTAMWTALGNASSNAQDCMGVVGFCVTDYSGTPYGMYATDLTTVRAGMQTSFAAWPHRP